MRLLKALLKFFLWSIVLAAGIAGFAVVAAWRELTMDLPPVDSPLARFIRERTLETDRLLVQSPDGYRYGRYETKAFAIEFDREVIGSNFPQVYDPAQFLSSVLFTRPLATWTPEQLTEAMRRWGIAWAFTCTERADELFTAAFGPDIYGLTACELDVPYVTASTALPKPALFM